MDSLQKAGIAVEGHGCALLDADLDLETLAMVAKDLPDTWVNVTPLSKRLALGRKASECQGHQRSKHLV